jgi:TRAP-type C4-dicarboxylate transport system permease small subunit
MLYWLCCNPYPADKAIIGNSIKRQCFHCLGFIGPHGATGGSIDHDLGWYQMVAYRPIGTRYSSRSVEMRRLIQVVDAVEIGWSLLLLTSILSMMTLQIICRYLLGSPLKWPEELAVLLACYLTFVGVSLVHRRHGHMSFTILVDQFPPGLQKVMNLSVHILTIILFFVIGYTSVSLQKMQSNFLYFAALPITKNYFTLPVTFCSVSMIINSIYFIYWEILKKEIKKIW